MVDKKPRENEDQTSYEREKFERFLDQSYNRIIYSFLTGEIYVSVPIYMTSKDGYTRICVNTHFQVHHLTIKNSTKQERETMMI